MKKLLFALVALALCSGMALATVPDPTQCTVLPCDNLGPPGIGGVVVCPGTPACIPAALVTVTVRNAAGNVIPNATIQVTMGSPLINGCATPDALPWDGVCDGNGVWSKCFNAGGCFDGPNACSIIANTVPIRNYTHVHSPDWNGGSANLLVQADDFASFLASYNPQTPGCHNYDNDTDTDLGDFVIFASGFNPGHQCP
jgi:hypothetical protein